MPGWRTLTVSSQVALGDRWGQSQGALGMSGKGKQHQHLPQVRHGDTEAASKWLSQSLVSQGTDARCNFGRGRTHPTSPVIVPLLSFTLGWG